MKVGGVVREFKKDVDIDPVEVLRILHSKWKTSLGSGVHAGAYIINGIWYEDDYAYHGSSKDVEIRNATDDEQLKNESFLTVIDFAGTVK